MASGDWARAINSRLRQLYHCSRATPGREPGRTRPLRPRPMPAHPAFPPNDLKALCDVLGDTENGLSGREIGELLSGSQIGDPSPTITKRRRLFEALKARQNQDQCSNAVLRFIQEAMAPVRYREQNDIFESRRDDLNVALAFGGWSLGEDGKLHVAQKATTLTEAHERASRLRMELQRRAVHPDVLQFCGAELLEKNYFHAVLEATKSVAEKIRRKTGLQNDGASLVDAAFGMGSSGQPLLAFNSLRSDSERSEQSGLMNLFKGALGTFRNPTAHAPKISWAVTEGDALEALTLLSMLHRRLDGAVSTRPTVRQP